MNEPHSPRVLILSASVGSGHVRAAEAVELALRQVCPQADVHNVDVLRLATPLFSRCYGGLYLSVAERIPGVLRFFYNLIDQPRDCSRPGVWDHFRLFWEKLGLGRLVALIRSRPWDLIINTHFLPAEIVADLRRRGQINTRQGLVTTDFETHSAWIAEPCELYTTATEEGALYLEMQGVSPGRTSVVGIPIHPVFSAGKTRPECLHRQGLGGDRPVLLQLAGGAGFGRVEALYRALLTVEEPVDLVVVTGRNETVRRRLEGVVPPTRHRVSVRSFTTEIDELMVAADLIVSKPGGLTTSEALACGTPLVVVDPIPCQEERNSDLLLEAGAAVKVNHLLTLGYKVTEILRDRDRLDRLRAAARHLGKPRAAFDVAEKALGLIGVSTPAARPAATVRWSNPVRPTN